MNHPSVLFLTAIALTTAPALAHEGDHGPGADHAHAPSAANQFTMHIDGETKAFDWIHRDDLGQQDEALIDAARGGLHNSADEDDTTGEVVTVVAKYGLVTLDRDLKAWSKVDGQDEIFAGGMNAHGADCFVRGGQSHWVFASTNTRQIVLASRGKVLAVLEAPEGDEFDHPTANAYYAGGGAFVPCDVVYEPSTDSLLVVTGYSAGDFVVTAQFDGDSLAWGGPAFGGKSNLGGPFATAHGIDLVGPMQPSVLQIASRSHGKLFGFTPGGAEVKLDGSPEGQYHIDLPAGSTPCDVRSVESTRFIPLLNALPEADNAAVMVLRDGKPAGQLIPADYEGLQYMRHMHGISVVSRGGKLFLVALTWPNAGENKAGKRNDGQIAIFEAVPQA